MSLFSSETLEGVEEGLFKTRTYKQALSIFYNMVLNLHLTFYQSYCAIIFCMRSKCEKSI